MNGTHEIIELTESYDFQSVRHQGIKPHKVENDINKLFEAIETRSSRGIISHSLCKSAMKSPISESSSLKQALRGLCISQASQMASLKKRSLMTKLATGAKTDQTRKIFPKMPLEKGECSQSSNSSTSEETCLSGLSRSGYRPHMSKDSRWEVIQKHRGILELKHFKLLRKIGSGDTATVYLSELIGTRCLFAVKVMDHELLVGKNKMHRAETEKEILEVLDHPFLPTLYAHFTTRRYSCLVMEYCPGGDLHALRQTQISRTFPEKAARFYAAEILVALEYLHMLGVVYRDLKPENVLIREDGHIMLSDFDLSLQCTVNPTVLKPSSPVKPMSSAPCPDSSCMHPSFQLSCFLTKTQKLKSELAAQVIPLPELIVEPITARSNSFVGTHEYLAPEIVKGEGHGNAVDWWTFGIFLYELLYGETPFKGSSNEDTISNVVSMRLEFPECCTVSSHARDLIRGLLMKEPSDRMGSTKGAAEIKRHPFFVGLNWALIRRETPPELPRCSVPEVGTSRKNRTPLEFVNGRDEEEFEMF